MNTALLDAMPQRPPGKWPFPPPPSAKGGRFAGRSRAAGGSQSALPADTAPSRPGTAGTPITLGRMLSDILMVLAWGALIPGLMWLGHLAGF